MTTEEKIKLTIPKPHSPEQLEFVKDTTLRQIIRAGRRFGKTWGAAMKALMAFLGVCPDCMGGGCDKCNNTGMVKRKRVLYAAPTGEQTDAFWAIVTDTLRIPINAGKLKMNMQEKWIEETGTRFRIKAKTAWNAETIRGDTADLAILEEFQMMNEDAWDRIVQPMMLDNNGTTVFIYTPPSLRSEGGSKAKDPRHASKLYKKYSDGHDPDWKTFHYRSDQNPTLSRKAFSMLVKDMNADVYRQEILAEDDEIEDSWMVYRKFNEKVCKIERFDIPKSWPVVSGHDFGSANPAALFLAKVKLPLPDNAPAAMRYGDYVLFREYAPGGESAVQHIEAFRGLTKGHEIEHSVGGNITTEEQIRQLYGANGWPIAAPNVTRVNAQIARVIGLMEMNKLFIFKDLYGLIGEIVNCLWELGDDNKPISKIKNEAKYHFLASLRYLCTYLPQERPLATGTGKIKVSTW